MALRQPKLVLKVSQVPDWGRRAIRLSLALTFFTTIAIWLWPVPEALRAEWGDEVRQTCNWAGASCAVVAASPLIGKVAQLSYERTLGTLTGGLLGFLVYDFGVLRLSDWASDVLMVGSAAAVGALSCYLSFRFSLDASMRLFVITFLIVMFGGGGDSALGVALLRTGGIITGVLLFMGLTVLILPKSATIEALREMKSGLKLLVELNTLVWTSRQEAEAALRAAAEQARAAELAAAAAAADAASKAAGLATAGSGGGSWGGSGRATGLWRSVATTLGALLSSQQQQQGSKYTPLLNDYHPDPEMGLTPGQPAAAAGPAAAAAAAAAGGDAHHHHTPVSQLSKALQDSSRSNQPQAAAAPGAAKPPPPLQQQQQQGQREGVSAYRSFMDAYEERCEGVLTKVYQSMFKVKEHVALAESELYVHHFCGHYIFLPMFFNRALCNWLLPRRWRLPAAALEDVSTSVRVIARLLWTVHLDFSQEGFDEVIQALPPAAGMSNLLLDVAAHTSGCLGVLVEAFPNKEAVLVDHLHALEALVNRMLAVSGAGHEGLIRDLAANRPKPARTHRADSAAPGPTPPSDPHQQQQQQQQQQSGGGNGHADRSPFSSLSRSGSDGVLRGGGLGARPAAAAVAAVSGSGEGLSHRTASTTLAAARLGVDLLSPRTQHHLQQQQQQGGGSSRRHEVLFVTYNDNQQEEQEEGGAGGAGTSLVGLSWNSFAADGPGPPIPATSPELGLPHSPPAAAAAAAVEREPSQAELMFGLPDSFVANSDSTIVAAAAAGGGGTTQPGTDSSSSSSRPGASSSLLSGPSGPLPSSPSAAAAGGGGYWGPHTQPPHFGRTASQRSSGSAGGAGRGASGPFSLSSSLIRAQFRPFLRTPTLRLSRPGQVAGQVAGRGMPQEGLVQVGSGPGPAPGPQQRSSSLAPGEGGTGGDSRQPGSPEAGSPFEHSFTSQGPQQQQQQQQQQGSSSSSSTPTAAQMKAMLRSVSAPDKAAAAAAVALLQQQQQQEGLALGLSAPSPEQEEWQQWQQNAEGSGGGAAAAAGGAAAGGGDELSTMLAALNDPKIMSFVKLTRWYSFQFLIMELLIEMNDLYRSIAKVLETLPHGL